MKTISRNESNDFAAGSRIRRVLALAIVLLGTQWPSASLLLAASATANPPPADATADPYLWLEDVTGEKPLDWVRQQNALSTRELEAQPDFAGIRTRVLSILNSKERIPSVTKHGRFLYNFWRDEQNVRGLWRRTTLAEYKKPQPKWETVLDLDQLATVEQENWVWKFANILEVTHDRALLSLSRGGGDATVVREFDLKKKSFITNGFILPEAKNRVDFRDRNTLFVGTDFGPGSMTKSGYPRLVKEWKRGTPLSQARTLFEGSADDVSVTGYRIVDHGRQYEFIERTPTFFTEEISVRRRDKWVPIAKPADAELRTFGDHLLLKLRTDWTIGARTYRGGSLLACDFDDFLKGKRQFAVLFEPTARTSLEDISATKNFLLLTELDNVRSRPFLLRYARGHWIRTPPPRMFASTKTFPRSSHAAPACGE